MRALNFKPRFLPVACSLIGLTWLGAGAYAQSPQAQSDARREQLAEHIRTGLQARDEHRLDAAALEFEAALAIAPNVAQLHASLGLVRHRQGTLTPAVESFRRALELKPDLNGVHGLLGFDLLMLGEFEPALGHLEKGRQEDPSNLEVRSWLGLAHFETGQHQKAIAIWESVRESKPRDLNVLLYLDKAYKAVLGKLHDDIRQIDPAKAKALGAEIQGGAVSAESKPAPMQHREPVIREQCTQCHRWSPPAILPKKAWLGKIQKMFALANDGMLASLGRPINKATVEEVVRYFETLSPKDLDTPPWLAAKNGRNLRFEHRALRKVAPGQGVPGTSNVRLMELFDDLPGPELVVCDMFSGWVSWADPDAPDSKLEGLARLSNPDHAEAVDLDQDGRMDLLVADLGEVMPSDKEEGSIVWLRRTSDPQKARQFEVIPLIEKIGRVADAQAADFDGDGDLDIIAAEFGWVTVGRILYLENLGLQDSQGRPSFRPVTLDDRPGGIHVPIVDLNGDGKPDFLALISQHHETVVAFLNRGDGQFEKKEVFTAPHPHWGTSGIEPADMDGDGDLDVLLTAGDTMDDQIQFKPYQGVSWLENQGSYPFVYHSIGRYYGAMRAEAGDLDGDGDLDVVAAAWLPELTEDKRKAMSLPGLVWFEQTSAGAFTPRVLRDDACDHPTLEIGDIDADGLLDVITGTAWLGTAPTDRGALAVEILRQTR